MKRVLLLQFTFFFTGFIFSQAATDSLWNVWNDNTKADTTRLKAMDDLINGSYLYSLPDSAFLLTSLQYNLANKSGNKFWMANALKTQGISLAIKNDYNRATVTLIRSLHLYEDIADTIGMAGIYNSFGNIFREQYMFDKALSNYQKSQQIYQEINDQDGLATVILNIGTIFFDQGNYASALDSYSKSLMLYKSINNQKGVANVTGAIGRIYEWQNDFGKALEYYRNSMEMYKLLGNKIGMANMFVQIGNVYAGMKEYDKALENYRESLKINNELKMRSGIASSLYNIGTIYKYKGDYTGSLDYTRQSIKICREINYKQLELSCLCQIGNVYYLLGNYQDAILYNREVLESALKMNSAQQILDASDILYKSYKKTDNYKDAIEMLELHTRINDSIIDEKSQRAFIRQEYKSEYERAFQADSLIQVERSKLVELTHQAELRKKNRTRNLLIMSGFIALLIVGGLWSRIRYIRKANLKLELEKERAEHSEQFKQQFLANMSHEIRTPMSAVLGMTNLTLDTKLTSKQKKYLKAIKKSSENLLVIINDILDLSKLEAGKMELERIPFNLYEQINQVNDTLKFKAEEKGLRFTTEIKEEVPEVVIGDPSRLTQVLINLCGNAIKFTEKGSVQVVVEKVNGSFNTLRFSIVDTGIGIPQDKLDKLFKSFQQVEAGTSRKYGGTGLGLSISKNLVELQHGTISVKSEVGKGSTFFFLIPFQIANKDQIAGLEDDLLTDEKALTGIRVLLAEDNEYNRIIVNDTLENLVDDVFVETAENGKIAIELLEKNDYDLILMDANMPEMDGMEASRYIRSHFIGNKQQIPIIALTASLLSNDIQKCLDAGMNAYVPKPFKRKELIGIMNRFYYNEDAVKSGADKKPVGHVKSKGKNKMKVNGSANLDFLREFCEGDESRMNKYIDMYIKSTPKYIEKLNDSLVKKDYASIKSTVHSMKPHLNFMGLGKVKNIADHIELCISEEKNLDSVKELVEILVESCEESIIELSSYPQNR